MPLYSVIVEVVQTRAYNVSASSADGARELVHEDFELIQYDTLEETVDSIQSVEDIS